MASVSKIKAWCMQQPRPHVVRVTGIDGQLNDVQCTGATWPKIAETICALQPELMQAMTPDNKLIRAARPNDASDDWQDDDSDPAGPRVPSLNNIPITAADPETQRFALVAQLIARAYEHSTTVAFERLAGICEALMQRSESVERARDQIHRAQIKQLEEQIKSMGGEPESQEGLLMQMASAFLGGAGGQQQQPPPAPPPAAPTNGKHHA